jgi:hypothetical protein
MTGRDHSATPGLPANGNGTFDRILNVYLPFEDPTALDPSDTCPAVEVFKDTPVEIVFGSDVSLLSGRTSFTPAAFQTYAVIEKGAPGKVATPVLLDTVDLTSDTRIDPGVFTHAAIYREDGAVISSSDLTGLTVQIDGVPVIDAATIPALAALYNAQRAQGGEPASALAASPYTQIPGEAIEEMPGGAVGAGGAVSVSLLPVLYPGSDGKLTKSYPAPNGMRVRYTGAATGLRLVTRRIEPVSDANVARAAQKMGLAASTVRPKTASGADTSPWKAAILPKRVS